MLQLHVGPFINLIQNSYIYNLLKIFPNKYMSLYYFVQLKTKGAICTGNCSLF